MFVFCICRAVGCILGELLNGSPLFPGENDIEQLCCVLRILSTPSPQVWPVCRALWRGGVGQVSSVPPRASESPGPHLLSCSPTTP